MFLHKAGLQVGFHDVAADVQVRLRTRSASATIATAMYAMTSPIRE
jgi:hypothetical protein